MVTLWLNMRAQAPGSSVLTHEYLLDISKAPSPPSFQILAYSLYTDRVLPPPQAIYCCLTISTLLSCPLPLLILWSCPVFSLQSFFFFSALGYPRCLWIFFPLLLIMKAFTLIMEQSCWQFLYCTFSSTVIMFKK